MKPILTPTRNGRLVIWEEPVERGLYVMGVDLAEGRVRDKTLSARRKLNSYSGERPDYTAACVCEAETGRHVASWHGTTTPHDFVPVAVAIAYHYNTAYIVPEINGPGLPFVVGLRQLNYPGIYRARMANVIDANGLQDEFGWRTTPHTRPLLIDAIHQIMSEKWPFTRDRGLVKEFRTMERDDVGIERARGNNKDDRVFAFGLAQIGRRDLLTMLPAERQRMHLDVRPNDESIYRSILRREEQRAYRDRGDRPRPLRPLRPDRR